LANFELGSVNVISSSFVRTRIIASKRTEIESTEKYQLFGTERLGSDLYLKTTPDQYVRSNGRHLNDVLKTEIFEVQGLVLLVLGVIPKWM